MMVEITLSTKDYYVSVQFDIFSAISIILGMISIATSLR